MSSRRGRRKSGRGRGKGKGRHKGRNQGSSLSANSSSSNLESFDNLNNQQNKTPKPQKQPEIFVGLDVGSSSIKIAVVQNNANSKLTDLQQLSSLFLNASQNSASFHSKINLLADDSGERCIPSVITILDSNHNETLIGTEAVKSSIRHYKNCIYHSKHLIALAQTNSRDIPLFQSQYKQWKKSASKFGMHKTVIPPRFDEEEDADAENDNKQREQNLPSFLKLKYKLKKPDGNSFKEYFTDYGFVCLLKKVFAVISSQTGSNRIHIVSSVPYYYTPAQITHYKSLLLQSGFNPLQIIYDYSASILSLHLDNEMNTQRVLCIDFGTFCSTFCVIKMCNGLITSQDEPNDNYYHKTMNISGMILDECVLKWLIKDFENRNRGCYIEIENAKTRLKLFKEMSRIKQVLSSGSNQVRFDIESLYEGIDYHFTLSKAKFESIIYDVLSAATNWIHHQITQCNTSFDKVIVSGGLSEIPKLQQTLQNIFGDKLRTKQLVSKGIASYFVNVYGCAVQAASLSYLYQFQNQLREGHPSLHKIIDIMKPNTNKNRNRNKKKQQNGTNTQAMDVFADKNVYLNAWAKHDIALSANKLCLYYILGQKRKPFCCIEKNTPLPFESNYKIEENEIKMALNGNKAIANDLTFDIAFTVDIVDDDDSKSVLETVEQCINNIALKSKKKNKTLVVNVSLDGNNDLSVCVGKQKVLFEFDEMENDNDSDEEEDEDEEDDEEQEANQNGDTFDID